MDRPDAWTRRLDSLLLRCKSAFEGFNEQHSERVRGLLLQLRESTVPLTTSLEHAHRLPGSTVALSLMGFGRAEQARLFLGVLWGGLRAGFVHAGIRKDSSVDINGQVLQQTGWEAVLVFQIGEQHEFDEDLLEEVCRMFPISVARVQFDAVNDEQMMAALVRIENEGMFAERIGNIKLHRHKKIRDLLKGMTLRASVSDPPPPPFDWAELRISSHANAVFRELIDASLLALDGLVENSRLPYHGDGHVRAIYGNLRQIQAWLQMQADFAHETFLWRTGLAHASRAPLLLVYGSGSGASTHPQWEL